MDAPALDPAAVRNLLACIDHELRTPLNGVTGAADLLAVTGLTAEQKEYVDTIARSGECLLGNLRNVIDYVKLAAGQLVLTQAPFALETALDEGLRTARERGARDSLSASRMTLGSTELRLEGKLPQGVLGDAARFRQVVSTLAGHVLQAGAGSPLTLAVQRTQHRSSETVTLRLGFSADAELASDRLQDLRRAFLHGEAGATPRMDGAGLALAIARGLVDLMGGRILPDELTPGEERLAIELTLETADVVALQPVHGQAPAEHRRDCRLLVVEDDAMAQRVAEALLDKAGYQHDLVENGKEAVRAAALVDYDVILMDLIMPVMDGIEATRTIREAETGTSRRTPIIAMTANGLVSDRSACRQLGMDDYIAKPVRAAVLYAMLEKWVAAGVGRSVPA